METVWKLQFLELLCDGRCDILAAPLRNEVVCKLLAVCGPLPTTDNYSERVLGCLHDTYIFKADPHLRNLGNLFSDIVQSRSPLDFIGAVSGDPSFRLRLRYGDHFEFCYRCDHNGGTPMRQYTRLTTDMLDIDDQRYFIDEMKDLMSTAYGYAATAVWLIAAFDASDILYTNATLPTPRGVRVDSYFLELFEATDDPRKLARRFADLSFGDVSQLTMKVMDDFEEDLD